MDGDCNVYKNLETLPFKKITRINTRFPLSTVRLSARELRKKEKFGTNTFPAVDK